MMARIDGARAARVVAASLGLAIAACGGGPGGGWSGTMQDSAGIAVVTNTVDGVWGPKDAPAVVKDLDIGAAEGDPHYQFSVIAGLDVASDGSIYVLDQQARKVRVFAPDGTFLREMGRAGSGPGELSQFAAGLMLAAGDTVIIADMMQQRLTRYSAEGEPIGSTPLPMAEGLPVKWAVLPDRTLVEQSRVMSFPGQAARAPEDHLLLRGSDGAVIDTLLELPAGTTIEFTANSAKIRLFDPEPIWALSTSGNVFYGMNSEYSIRVYSADGKVERVVRKPFERQPVTQADRDALMRFMEETFKRQGLPPQALEIMKQSITIGDQYPAFANLLGGPENSIWVQRVTTAADMKEGEEFDVQDQGAPDWDVFDADGRLLGVITLPDHFTPMLFRGNQLYGVWRDELDVQHVVRLRIGAADWTAG